MITVDEYVRKVLAQLPIAAADAFDPQVVQTGLAAEITKNYGGTVRQPVYPRTDKDPRLQLVDGNLFKAATVYRAKGNVSSYQRTGNTYSFVWGIDLNVIPYARIHEYGGQAGRNLAATIPKRPYIGPSIEAYQKDGLVRLVDIMLRRLAEAVQ